MAGQRRSSGREEFVNGQWIGLPPPSPAHFRLIQRLNDLLRAQLDPDSFVVITTDFGLGVEPGFQACRNPDLVVFSRGALQHSRTENDNLFATPALIAECLSPRDRKGAVTDLLSDYRRMRANEVWIIDPRQRIIESHRLAGDFERPVISTDGNISPLGLPGATISMQSLWAAFDGEW